MFRCVIPRPWIAYIQVLFFLLICLKKENYWHHQLLLPLLCGVQTLDDLDITDCTTLQNHFYPLTQLLVWRQNLRIHSNMTLEKAKTPLDLESSHKPNTGETREHNESQWCPLKSKKKVSREERPCWRVWLLGPIPNQTIKVKRPMSTILNCKIIIL